MIERTPVKVRNKAPESMIGSNEWKILKLAR
jgi:hypothetical protein